MLGLKYIRKLYGLTLENVSDFVKVSKQTVSKWENGQMSITYDNLKKLSELFFIPQEYFFKELTDDDVVKLQEHKLMSELKMCPNVLTNSEEEKEVKELSEKLLYPDEIKFTSAKEGLIQILENQRSNYHFDTKNYDWTVINLIKKFTTLLALDGTNLTKLDNLLTALLISNGVIESNQNENKLTVLLANILDYDKVLR